MGSPAIHPIGAFVQGPNPIQDIISGMLQGVELHGQMQRAQDEHTAMQHAAMQQARNNRIQDITQKMMLQANSREVGPDGTVTEQNQLPGFSVGGVDMPAAPVSYARKADRSRTVKYRDQEGNEMQRELLTPMEQIQRQVTADQAVSRAQGKIMDVDPDSALGQMLGIKSSTTLPTTAVPQLYRQITSGENNQRTNEARENVAETNAGARKYTADTNADARTVPKLTRTYPNDQNQMVGVYSDGTTKILGPALAKTAGKAATSKGPTVFAQRQQAADQTKVDGLQRQEQSLWAQKAALETAVGTPDGGKIPNPLNPKTSIQMTAGYRQTHQANLDATTKKIASLQQQQKQLIEKWGGTYDPNGAPAGPGRGEAVAGAKGARQDPLGIR